MPSGSVVFYKIMTTCLLIFVGYISRRMKLVSEESLSVVSKFTLNLALPAYVMYYMPSSISRETVAAYWFYPILGGFLLMVADMFGLLTGKWWNRGGWVSVGTFRMLVGVPNWMFMAMAVVEPLFGDPGVRVVLLFNLGITVYLWSFGMTSFRAGIGWTVIKSLFLNPQMIGAGVGIFLAFCFPAVRGLERLDAYELAGLPIYHGIFSPVWETVYLVGSTALPLSILSIGFYLGAPEAVAGFNTKRDNLTLVAVSFLRLVAAPVISILILMALVKCGLRMGGVEFVAASIVMAMPSAVACISVSDVYNGDPKLAARAILWSTIASLVTAPAMTWAATAAYGIAAG